MKKERNQMNIQKERKRKVINGIKRETYTEIKKRRNKESDLIP